MFGTAMKNLAPGDAGRATPIRRPGGDLRARAALAAVSALLICAGTPTGTARAADVSWGGDVEAALARAAQTGQRVLLEFDANWCPSCRQLEREVLHAPEGAALARQMIPVRLDFDAPANRRFVERYVVLGLPTVVVLDAHGTQVGRIMGYEGKDHWLGQARAALEAGDPLPALRAAVARTPDDHVATLALGRALLVRGEKDEGERLLESLLWQDDQDDKKAREAAAEALFVLGRYYHRVRRQPSTAHYIWRALAQGHPDSPWAAGAWWWYARAEAEQGRPGNGLKALRARAHQKPQAVAALDQWGNYVLKYRLKGSRDEAVAGIEKAAAALGEAERAELKPMLEKLRAM